MAKEVSKTDRVIGVVFGLVGLMLGIGSVMGVRWAYVAIGGLSILSAVLVLLAAVLGPRKTGPSKGD